MKRDETASEGSARKSGVHGIGTATYLQKEESIGELQPPSLQIIHPSQLDPGPNHKEAEVHQPQPEGPKENNAICRKSSFPRYAPIIHSQQRGGSLG
jgi:hypothetical protein